jgi:acyl-CoA reductase-like NAD-dependent aldehyde dehydrogenase
MSNQFFMLIDGELVPGAGTSSVVNPSTGQVFASAPDASRDQLNLAVRSARAAFPGWSSKTWAERSAVLRVVAQTYRDNIEALALLLTKEQGKPLSRSRAEIAGAAFWISEIAGMESPEEDLQNDAKAFVRLRHVPLGVVAGMVPWNYPIALAAWKIAPALIAGNTLLLTPSPYTPLSTLRLGELLQKVLPKGVLNVVSGGDSLGPWISEHSGIDKIAFTGSTETGRKVMHSASVNLKRLTLELGGNDPAIVMPDVDIASVAKSLFWGAFMNSGQMCIAAKRIYVHESIYEEFSQEFIRIVRATRVGAGESEDSEVGPVQNKIQLERLKELVRDCRQQGINFLVGGTDLPGPGFFFPLTVVDNPPDTSRIVREEPFGPIVPLLKFSDIDDVIGRANDSDYGLAASIWSKDEAVALAMAARINAGTVWINEIQAVSPHRPFAGHKQSGFGVENGIAGILEYTAPQVVTLNRMP